MHMLQNDPFLGFGIKSLFMPVSLGSATHNGHSELVVASPFSKVCFCRRAHHHIISQVIHLGIAGTTNCTFYNYSVIGDRFNGDSFAKQNISVQFKEASGCTFVKCNPSKFENAWCMLVPHEVND